MAVTRRWGMRTPPAQAPVGDGGGGRDHHNYDGAREVLVKKSALAEALARPALLAAPSADSPAALASGKIASATSSSTGSPPATSSTASSSTAGVASSDVGTIA
eukprot:CAMPEP_0118925936 /NCGR_PEP_ID=MMETSP1169-20130426/3734_1 /TAXON_ID=36882 /ORGANISM="Pyramimonas obovata, Strain CCMP722" /LENGTH=103 /DNA_ID=CAMNT_0006867369 /DNA_START=450 /DNA_END=759 /DNA_ORIENTATION=+